MRRCMIVGLGVLFAGTRLFAADATVVGSWSFNNNFHADQAGVPDLTPVDPTATSNFLTDNVFGQTRTVWNFTGNASPTNQQGGFTLNTTGLVTPESYSVDMVFEFTQRDGAWRRILDVQNRQSDSGLYVDPSDNLDIYPISGSSASWDNNVYHHLVMTDNGTTVTTYLDGVSQFSATTTEMNLDFDTVDNPNALLNVFLDNVVAGGQGEWSAGNIALFRVWDGVLTADEAAALATHPFATPEPASLSLLLGGSLMLLRRRRGRASR